MQVESRSTTTSNATSTHLPTVENLFIDLKYLFITYEVVLVLQS